MQNIFVMRDPLAPMDPCAWIAKPASIYWNDQDIQWKLILQPTSKANWDPDKTSPIEFGADWEGRKPWPVPDSPGLPPFYQATGPGATPIQPITYNYTIYLKVPECVKGTVTISATVTDQPKM
jgi:hypothetical protein